MRINTDDTTGTAVDEETFVINPVNRYSDPIRLPTNACIPVPGNVSDVSLRSSEGRFRESELMALPKAGVAFINSNPIARPLDEALIPTSSNAKRVIKPRFLSITPLRKKQTAYGSCACSFCFIIFILLWIFIPRYPLPKFLSQEIILDNISGVLVLKQYYSLYNNNFYNLEITNWNMNMTYIIVNYEMTTIVFQTYDNEVSIPAKTSAQYYLLQYNNYTSNENNYDKFAQYCNITMSILPSSYSVSLEFKGRFYPTFQYNQEGSTASTPYDGQFNCMPSS